MGIIKPKFNHHYFNFILIAILIGLTGFSEPLLCIRSALENYFGKVLAEVLIVVTYIILISLYILFTKMIKKQTKHMYLLKFAGCVLTAFSISTITTLLLTIIHFSYVMWDFH